MPPEESSDDPRLPDFKPEIESTPPVPNVNFPPTSPPPPTKLKTPNPKLSPLISPTPNHQITIPRSTRKIFFTSVLLLLIFFSSIVGAGLALAYNDYEFFKPPKPVLNAIDNLIVLSPLPKPKRIVLASAISKSTTLKSADLKMDFSISTTSQSSPVTSIKLAVAGPADFNENSRASEADINLAVKFEGAEFSGGVSLKAIDDIVYFKVSEFPFGSVYQKYLSYKNKWFYWKIPEEYKPKEKDVTESARINKVFSSFIEKSKDWTELLEKDENTYLLTVNPPREEINNFIYEILKAYEPETEEDKQLIASLKTQEVNKFTEKLKNLKITVLVNKSDFYIKRADFSFDIAVENFSLPVSQEILLPNEQLTYNVAFSMEFSNYNKNIVIIPPEDARNFQDLLDEIKKSLQEQEEPLESSPEAQEFNEFEQENPQKELDELIPLDENVLGNKSSWDREVFKLFSSLFK